MQYPIFCQGLFSRTTVLLDRLCYILAESLRLTERGQIHDTPMFRADWNNTKATLESHIDGWFKNGDVGYMDKQDYLFIIGRLKDMFICGGENIACVKWRRLFLNSQKSVTPEMTVRQG